MVGTVVLASPDHQIWRTLGVTLADTQAEEAKAETSQGPADPSAPAALSFPAPLPVWLL
jgi:hypothetical protein